MAAEAQLVNWQNAVDNRIDFSKNAYLEAIPDMANANAAAEVIGHGLNQVSADQGRLADTLSTRVDKFAGMQDTYGAGAFAHNSPERQRAVSNQAQADVTSQYANLAGQGARELNRRGVNPGAGRSLAMANQLGIAQASAQAGASSKALSDLESVANERQKTAIGFGANLPSQSSQAAQVAASTGNYAVNAASQPLANKLNFAGGVSNIYGNDASGNAELWKAQNMSPDQAAAISANQQTRDDNNDAAMWSGIGNLVTSDAGQNAISSAWDWLTS